LKFGAEEVVDLKNDEVDVFLFRACLDVRSRPEEMVDKDAKIFSHGFNEGCIDF
jgi:hypothetical protein